MRIVTWDPVARTGDSVLRQKARPAGRVERRLLVRLDARMRLTLAASGGVGLAAPQVGIPLRVILVQLQDPGRTVVTCIDPVVELRGPDMMESYEGCLSIPGKGGKVMRHDFVQVACTDLDGRRRIYESSGFEAVIFQHEVDHLDGVLYTDRLVGELMPIEEMRRRRAEESARKAAAPSPDSEGN